MASSELPKLSGRHEDTLQRIFTHPSSHNIEWRQVRALLSEVTTVTEHDDGRIGIRAGDHEVVLPRPRNKDIDMEELVDVRRLLEELGYGPKGA